MQTVYALGNSLYEKFEKATNPLQSIYDKHIQAVLLILDNLSFSWELVCVQTIFASPLHPC